MAYEVPTQIIVDELGVSPQLASMLKSLADAWRTYQRSRVLDLGPAHAIAESLRAQDFLECFLHGIHPAELRAMDEIKESHQRDWPEREILVERLWRLGYDFDEESLIDFHPGQSQLRELVPSRLFKRFSFWELSEVFDEVVDQGHEVIENACELIRGGMLETLEDIDDLATAARATLC